ncbi:hypothetical protein [Tolumonas lignilytica]|jgi:hypothetical protein|uniref:hypothetical protein n=1 Tax=Tolumonas lignilytica TaxID=1283284 RepID=UPI0004638478|nr:hypothetical protein [Tolumonas lignilytica]
MELHNKAGDVTKLADDLTLEEVEEMGLTIDLCDTAFDPNEHWLANEDDQDHKGKKSPSGSSQK